MYAYPHCLQNNLYEIHIRSLLYLLRLFSRPCFMNTLCNMFGYIALSSTFIRVLCYELKLIQYPIYTGVNYRLLLLQSNLPNTKYFPGDNFIDNKLYFQERVNTPSMKLNSPFSYYFINIIVPRLYKLSSYYELAILG